MCYSSEDFQLTVNSQLFTHHTKFNMLKFNKNHRDIKLFLFFRWHFKNVFIELLNRICFFHFFSFYKKKKYAIEIFWEYFWLPMHYEQQETLLTPPEINGSKSVSSCRMEDVNTKSSLTPQIAGPSPFVFSSFQKNPWQELSFFQSSNFQESFLHIPLFLLMDSHIIVKANLLQECGPDMSVSQMANAWNNSKWAMKSSN